MHKEEEKATRERIAPQPPASATAVTDDYEEHQEQERANAYPYRYEEAFWPNYKLRGRKRQRCYAIGRTSLRERAFILIDETGERMSFPLDEQGYHDCVRIVATRRLSVETRFRIAPSDFPRDWIDLAINDTKHTEVRSSERETITCIEVRSGRARGAFVSGTTWNREGIEGRLGHALDDVAWLQEKRKLAALLEVGDQDTLAGFGTSCLYHYWQEHRLSPVRRLPAALMEQLQKYVVAAHIDGWDTLKESIEQITRESMHEYDLKSAYPAVVAQGLPWGEPAFMGNGYEPSAETPAFGLYEVYTPDEVPNSPVPWRNYDIRHSPVHWTLPPGKRLICGWKVAIDVLRQRGVLCKWIGGWRWLSYSKALGGWVEQTNQLRERCEQTDEPILAGLIKNSLNAAIGRWGMDTRKRTFVPVDQLEAGDTIKTLDPTEYDSEQYAIHTDRTDIGKARPLHWFSYTRMVISLELCLMRQRNVPADRQRQIATSTDALFSQTELDLSSSPFRWKHTLWESFEITANRSYEGIHEGEFDRKRPGVPKEHKLSDVGMGVVLLQ